MFVDSPIYQKDPGRIKVIVLSQSKNRLTSSKKEDWVWPLSHVLIDIRVKIIWTEAYVMIKQVLVGRK